MKRFGSLTALRSVLLLVVCFILHADSARAAEITGTITNAEGGEPLGKIQISLVGTSFSTTTSTDGTFHISGLPPAMYILHVSGLGYRIATLSFQFGSAQDSKDFQIALFPDHFKRTDVVKVSSGVFEAADWPAVGDMTLTSSELHETSTVLANDPFRSLQSLPGVSATANNDFLAQFSVMGAPYEDVGIYLDDVLVPNLLHAVSSFADAPTLSLLTSNNVEEIRLMPVAYPMRYADGSGAALVIRTRGGVEGAPHFHASVGLADTEFLGEGAFGNSHKANWLVGARKSYLGYLERTLVNSSFSDDGFYDADLKLTYQLTPTQTLSFLATGGQLHISDPSLTPGSDPNFLKSGSNDLAIARLGWRWVPTRTLLVDARVAYLRNGFEEANPSNLFLNRSLDREWTTGFNVSWSWHRAAVLQAGYSYRKPSISSASQSFHPPLPPVSSTFDSVEFRHDGYVQNSLQLWHDRLRIQGGLRWSRLDSLRVQPVTGQLSVSIEAIRNLRLEAACGRYAQLPFSGKIRGAFAINGELLAFRQLPRLSWQCLAAVEQKLGERARIRAEVFDRQNEQRDDFLTQPPAFIPVQNSVLSNRDYSRGLQLLFQRRSENRLSGWVGYTLVYARSRFYSQILPPPFGTVGFNSPYFPTSSDQRHNFNLFATYRLTPSLRLSAKNLYGSGFPVEFFPSVLRLPSYERLDLRVDKSRPFRKWKLTLYGELLNVTNHDNRRFVGIFNNPVPGQSIVVTDSLLPITPTLGLDFDF